MSQLERNHFSTVQYSNHAQTDHSVPNRIKQRSKQVKEHILNLRISKIELHFFHFIILNSHILPPIHHPPYPSIPLLGAASSIVHLIQDYNTQQTHKHHHNEIEIRRRRKLGINQIETPRQSLPRLANLLLQNRLHLLHLLVSQYLALFDHLIDFHAGFERFIRPFRRRKRKIAARLAAFHRLLIAYSSHSIAIVLASFWITVSCSSVCG